MKNIGEKITRLRKEAGYTQKDFAKKIGISQPFLIKFEKGETDIIPLGIAIKIADEFFQPFNDLFEIKDPQVGLIQHQIKELESSYNQLMDEYEERGKFIDILHTQLKTVRTYLVDKIIDTNQDWIDNYYDYEKSNEWNMNNLALLIKKDKKLLEEIKKIRSEIKWFLRSGIFTQDDYEGNLNLRIENGLPAIDVLKLPLGAQ